MTNDLEFTARIEQFLVVNPIAHPIRLHASIADIIDKFELMCGDEMDALPVNGVISLGCIFRFALECVHNVIPISYYMLSAKIGTTQNIDAGDTFFFANADDAKKFVGTRIRYVCWCIDASIGPDGMLSGKTAPHVNTFLAATVRNTAVWSAFSDMDLWVNPDSEYCFCVIRQCAPPLPSYIVIYVS